MLLNGILIYVGLVLLFTHQSIIVSVANKTGKKTTKAGFIGLIPGFGMWYYMKIEPEKKLSATSIPNIFKLRNIFGTMVIYAELVMLSFVVIVPIIYTIGTSLSPNSGILNTIWPDNPSLVNYQFLLTGERDIGGQVETTEYSEEDLFKKATLSPLVDYNTLTILAVIISP